MNRIEKADLYRKIGEKEEIDRLNSWLWRIANESKTAAGFRPLNEDQKRLVRGCFSNLYTVTRQLNKESERLYREIEDAFAKWGEEDGPHDLNWREYLHALALNTQGESA